MFKVKIASSGEVITVEDGVRIVDALGEHGIIIPVSCEQGICGTCLTGVLRENRSTTTYFKPMKRKRPTTR